MGAASLAITDADRVQAYLAAKNGSQSMVGFDPTGVTRLASVVSAAIESRCHRRFLRADRTEVFNVRRLQRMLAVDAFPIDTGETLEMREATDRDFTSSSTVVPSSYYAVDAEAGTILLDGGFLGGTGSVRLRWTGGLALTTDALETAAPDLVEVASMWVAELWDRRDTMSVRSTTGGRNTAGKEYYSLGAPPPFVETVIGQYAASRMTRV